MNAKRNVSCSAEWACSKEIQLSVVSSSQVSTTIMENGIDIPNVNTVIIQQTHMFGLSQLHQLRGRVGRSNIRAYAWLMHPPTQLLSDDALRRMRVLQQDSVRPFAPLLMPSPKLQKHTCFPLPYVPLQRLLKVCCQCRPSSFSSCLLMSSTLMIIAFAGYCAGIGLWQIIGRERSTDTGSWQPFWQ